MFADNETAFVLSARLRLERVGMGRSVPWSMPVGSQPHQRTLFAGPVPVGKHATPAISRRAGTRTRRWITMEHSSRECLWLWRRVARRGGGSHHPTMEPHWASRAATRSKQLRRVAAEMPLPVRPQRIGGRKDEPSNHGRVRDLCAGWKGMFSPADGCAGTERPRPGTWRRGVRECQLQSMEQRVRSVEDADDRTIASGGGRLLMYASSQRGGPHARAAAVNRRCRRWRSTGRRDATADHRRCPRSRRPCGPALLTGLAPAGHGIVGNG